MKVKDLTINQQISDCTYQIRNASYREGEGNKGYYLMRLGDRTGQIDAIWLNTPNKSLKVGDFLSVSGKIQNYQGRMQLKINLSKKLDPETIDQSLFNITAVDEKDLTVKLAEYIELIEIKPLYNLIKRLLLEDLYPDFIKAPAASFNHHSYMGGLLEHSINVTNICSSYLQIYPGINKDILLAGALIHDIGKIYEFEYDESISYSTKGNLLGHIFIGAQKFYEESKKEKDFPEHILNHITHIILSHHGLIERGSPVEPRTLEAILVHKADTTDADANAFLISKNESAGDSWLVSRTLNRLIYVESEPTFELRDKQ